MSSSSCFLLISCVPLLVASENAGSVTLRVATMPNTDFDGTTNATFGASGFVSPPAGVPPTSSAVDDGVANSSVTGTQHTQEADPSASFNVTFFHCAAGSYWNHTRSSVDDFEECISCTEGIYGAKEVQKAKSTLDLTRDRPCASI